VYQSATEVLQSKHSYGPQPDIGEQVQNVE
jgi:hypothetical protein